MASNWDGCPKAVSKLSDIEQFYALLGDLQERIGGPYYLSRFDGWLQLPKRGAYFFFEASETRTDSGDGGRVVRVGTHALRLNSKSTLAQRLRQHRGAADGTGNHRGSIFRLLIGQALIAKGIVGPCASWGVGNDLSQAVDAIGLTREEVRSAEMGVETAVSKHLHDMPFLWLKIEDDPGPLSLRHLIERGSIALLSNLQKNSVDKASHSWLGHSSDRPLVRNSGLWNQRDVDAVYDPLFLEILEHLISSA